MRQDAARAVVRCGRAVLLGALLVAALSSTVAAAPARAADPTPVPGPRASSPSVSPPSQRQIDDARNALERLRNAGRSKPAPTPATTLTEVSGPVAGHHPASFAARMSEQAWWTVGAGILVLLVLSETTRIGVRRAKHRRGA